MSSRLSKIRSVHTYVMPRTVYFGWICNMVESKFRDFASKLWQCQLIRLHSVVQGQQFLHGPEKFCISNDQQLIATNSGLARCEKITRESARRPFHLGPYFIPLLDSPRNEEADRRPHIANGSMMRSLLYQLETLHKIKSIFGIRCEILALKHSMHNGTYFVFEPGPRELPINFRIFYFATFNK